MRTQYLHDTVYDICRESDKCYVKKCVYIFTATGRKKHAMAATVQGVRKGVRTDPKKHFEVINFILGHFVNFLEEIYQEKILDVSSPLKKINIYILILEHHLLRY